MNAVLRIVSRGERVETGRPSWGLMQNQLVVIASGGRENGHMLDIKAGQTRQI